MFYKRIVYSVLILAVSIISEIKSSKLGVDIVSHKVEERDASTSDTSSDISNERIVTESEGLLTDTHRLYSNKTDINLKATKPVVNEPNKFKVVDLRSESGNAPVHSKFSSLFRRNTADKKQEDSKIILHVDGQESIQHAKYTLPQNDLSRPIYTSHQGSFESFHRNVPLFEDLRNDDGKIHDSTMLDFTEDTSFETNVPWSNNEWGPKENSHIPRDIFSSDYEEKVLENSSETQQPEWWGIGGGGGLPNMNVNSPAKANLPSINEPQSIPTNTNIGDRRRPLIYKTYEWPSNTKVTKGQNKNSNAARPHRFTKIALNENNKPISSGQRNKGLKGQHVRRPIIRNNPAHSHTPSKQNVLFVRNNSKNNPHTSAGNISPPKRFNSHRESMRNRRPNRVRPTRNQPNKFNKGQTKQNNSANPKGLRTKQKQNDQKRRPQQPMHFRPQVHKQNIDTKPRKRRPQQTTPFRSQTTPFRSKPNAQNTRKIKQKPRPQHPIRLRPKPTAQNTKAHEQKRRPQQPIRTKIPVYNMKSNQQKRRPQQPIRTKIPMHNMKINQQKRRPPQPIRFGTTHKTLKNPENSQPKSPAPILKLEPFAVVIPNSSLGAKKGTTIYEIQRPKSKNSDSADKRNENLNKEKLQLIAINNLEPHKDIETKKYVMSLLAAAGFSLLLPNVITITNVRKKREISGELIFA